MRRPTLALAASIAVLCGCGGDDGPEPVRAAAATEREVRAVFDDYTAARREGDWARACRHLAPETVRSLRRDGAKLRRRPGPDDCASILALFAGAVEGDDRRQLEQVTRTAKVDGVYETEPRRAGAVVIAWAAQVDGNRVAIQQPARRIGGAWKLIGAGVG